MQHGLDIFFAIVKVSFVLPKLIQITEEALKLPQADQLRLARTLLESSEAKGDSDALVAWEEEIERRIALIDAGTANHRPFAEVVREIDQQWGQ